MRKEKLAISTWRAIELLPILLPTSLLSFGTVAILLLLLGRLDALLVWPIGLLAVFLSGKLVIRHSVKQLDELPGTVKERRVVGVAVLLLVFFWTIFNAVYSYQDAYISRDPSIYNVAAEWLVKHDSLVIPGSSVFGDNPDILPDTASFGTLPETGDRLYVHAPHLLPALLGLVGRMGGASLMLHSNVIFGGLALLSVFALARVFMRPRWALLAVSVLAVSLPMIYFSRDTYSEPLTLMLVFGGLTLVWLAQKSQSGPLWLLAGVAAGSSVLTRIDAYMVVASFLLFAFITLMLSKHNERKTQIKYMTLFSVGMVSISIIGYADLAILSARYLHDLRPEFNAQLLLLAFIVVAGCISVWLSWRTGVLIWIKKNTKRWLPMAGVVFVILFALFLASRPLWYQGHYSMDNPLVKAIQRTEGSAIDGTRSYAEYSLYWIAWYTGPMLALASLAGAAVICRRVLSDWKYKLYLPLLLVVFVTAIIYLNLPKITPDQIWASRRFLPVVFPGFAIMGGLALDIFSERLKKHRRPILGAIIAAIMIPPLFISYPFLRTRLYTPELSQIQKVCDVLPPKAAVLFVGKKGFYTLQTIRTYCDVAGERITSPDPEDIREAAKSARSQGYTPYVLVFSEERKLLGGEAKSLSFIDSITYEEMARVLSKPPRKTNPVTSSVYIGEVNKNGKVEGVK